MVYTTIYGDHERWVRAPVEVGGGGYRLGGWVSYRNLLVRVAPDVESRPVVCLMSMGRDLLRSLI